MYSAMRIVYCINSVCLMGGTEIVTIVKANALAKMPDNEVWIAVSDAPHDPVIPLQGVHLVDLGVNYFTMQGTLALFQKLRLHKQRLEKVLNEIKPDVVIAMGQYEKGVIPSLKLVSKPVLIREVHFEKNYRRKDNTSLKGNLLAWMGEMYDYHWKIKGYDHIVILTEEDKERNWKGWKNVLVMPNPITSVCEEKSTCENKTAIAVGRLAEQKDFASLIRIWGRVAEKHPDWRLEIWGKGELEAALRQQIEESGLEGKVCLMGYTAEPLKKMSQASMYLLTSQYEGLPLVLIEAMSVGLPLVSYICPTGPRDIIEDGQNGYLVAVGDEKTFAERVCQLIEDEPLRKQMGQAGLKESEKYRIEDIAQRWMQLFRELLAKESSRRNSR